MGISNLNNDDYDRGWMDGRDSLESTVEKLEAENARLRRGVDNIKIRSYELGQKELHDMAWKLLEADDATEKEHWADTAFWREI